MTIMILPTCLLQHGMLLGILMETLTRYIIYHLCINKMVLVLWGNLCILVNLMMIIKVTLLKMRLITITDWICIVRFNHQWHMWLSQWKPDLFAPLPNWKNMQYQNFSPCDNRTSLSPKEEGVCNSMCTHNVNSIIQTWRTFLKIIVYSLL